MWPALSLPGVEAERQKLTPAGRPIYRRVGDVFVIRRGCADALERLAELDEAAEEG